MTKEKVKKIIVFLFGDIITIKLKIPMLFLIYFLGIPIFAYMDFLFIGKVNFIKYIYVCSLEWFLIWLGYIFASYELRIKK